MNVGLPLYTTSACNGAVSGFVRPWVGYRNLGWVSSFKDGEQGERSFVGSLPEDNACLFDFALADNLHSFALSVSYITTAVMLRRTVRHEAVFLQNYLTYTYT